MEAPTKEVAEHTENTTRRESATVEKGDAVYDQYRTEYDDDDRAPEARGRDAGTIDRAYWLSPRFLGSMAAIGLGFCGGTGMRRCSLTVSKVVVLIVCFAGGYALIAPVLDSINEDIGPSDNIAWVSIVYVRPRCERAQNSFRRDEAT